MKSLQSEDGYLMLSTIFLLILSGLMVQSIIRISTNQEIQFHQISESYQEKAALNMAEYLFLEEMKINNYSIKSGEMMSSVGDIVLSKKSTENYQLTLTTRNGRKLVKEIITSEVQDTINLEIEETESSRSLLLENEEHN